MANLKNITELPVAESAEGLNLIVNDNGSAKQIAASAVGAQADFAVTDENSPAFIKNKPEVAQADWNQNDSSAPNYVNNRTHWVDEEVVLERQTIDGFTEMDGMYVSQNFVHFEAVESEEVKVFWDGEIYNCVVVLKNNYLNIGNMSIYGEEDTGEPFAIMQLTDEWGVMAYTDASPSHKIGITREVVHKLEEKYVPRPVEEWDLDVNADFILDAETGEFNATTLTINAGTFENVKNKILNGVPKIKVTTNRQLLNGTTVQSSECYAMYAPEDVFNGNPELISVAFYDVYDDLNIFLMLLPDNTITVE